MEEAAALQAVAEADLVGVTQLVTSAEVEAGLVVGTEPPVPAELIEGDTVVVFVSEGEAADGAPDS